MHLTSTSTNLAMGQRSRPLALLLACAATVVLAFSAQAQDGPAVLPSVAVGPQYDTTHVYVAPQDVDKFVQSFIATFGGSTTRQVIVTVTPTPSKTTSQLVQTPFGAISVFGFKTRIPYPFGAERTGYLVSDLDVALKSARQSGADIVVAAFPDAIGRDAVIQWPGGIAMQLYSHNTAPHYEGLSKVPENRVYVSPDRVAAFTNSFITFSHGKVVSDNPAAPGIEIGKPGENYRRLRIESTFGKMTVIVTDGQLPFPYGRETTGYEVDDIAVTLARARAASVQVIVPSFEADNRLSAMVEFPGGFIAEIHASSAVK